jgi:CHASE3 domain sensor protein
MADNLTFKQDETSKRANRKLWTVTVIVAAVILLIAMASWVNLHVH